MKNIKRKIITIIFVLTLAMCGCGTGNTDKSAHDPTEDNVYRVVFPSNAVSFCNKGVCKLESGIANFWDAETKQSVVLCSKPNCSHTKRQASGESCDAFLGNRVDLLFMNGQNIYYICEMGSGNDGLGSIFDRKMVKADLNGKNRKTIFEFENIQEVGGINNAYCSEDCFAFAYCVSESREKPEDDIVLGKLEKRKAGVYLVNLETEEKKLINEIEEYGAYVYFVYIDDGKVYYVLSYRTEYLDYSDTNVKEGNYDKSIHRYDFCSYDIETGENKTIRSFNGSEITFFSQPSGGYYIFENETECIFYKNGKEVAKYTIDKLAEHDPPYINKYVYNDTLYMTDTEKVWCMDIVTGKIQYLGNGKLDNKYIGTIDAMINGLVYYNIWDPETWKNTSYVIEYKDFIDGNIENSTEVSFKGNTNKSEPGNMSSDALPLESTKNTTENEKQSTSRNSEEDDAITNDPKYLNFDYAEDIPDEEWNVDKNTIIWAFFDDIGIFGNVEEHINEKLEKDGYPFKIKCIVLGKKEYTQRVKDCRADIIFDGLGFPDSTYKWSVMHDAILEGKILKLDEYLSGSRLYDFFPEAMWESIRVDGSLYSIPNTNFYDSSLAVVFKKSAYTEEEIESFDNTLDGLLKLVDPDRKLYLWDSDCWTGYLDMYGIQNYEEYGIYYEDDEIKNLMDLDINIRWIKELHNLAEQGMLINGKNIVYQECKDDWSVALLNCGIKPDLDENEYYVVKYKGDMYPRYGGAIAIRENSHNPEYAFKLLELLITDSEYGNLIVYGENVTEKDGYAVDPDTGKTIYSWNRRLQWGINDGILKGTSDDRCTFSSPEERKTYYKTYFREAATSYYGYYELCKGLGDLFQKHNNIIFKKGDIDEELNEWIKEADEIFEKYGP